MSEWQPIATAPRDGTSVLIAVDGLVHLGRWFGGAKWQIADRAFDARSPTHWLPLPAPPASPTLLDTPPSPEPGQ